MDIIKTLLWIMIALNILITIFLCSIYLISKSFRSYPCYLNIILSFVILVDNLLRLISKDKEWFCYFQAIGLTIFDKLTVIVMTINAYLTYVGFVHYKFYKKYIKALFFISMTIGLLGSIIYTIIFILQDEPTGFGNVCYIKSTDSKRKVDVAIQIILANINFYCIINTLISIDNIINEVKAYKNIDDYLGIIIEFPHLYL